MSYVIATPQALTTVAADLANIGSTLQGASATAAGPTHNLLAAAEDEVSTAIAQLFGSHAQAVPCPQRAGGGLPQRVHPHPVRERGSYAASPRPPTPADAGRASRGNASTDRLLGRPLIGNGANGVRRHRGTAGTAGFWGNGGNGGSGAAGQAADTARLRGIVRLRRIRRAGRAIVDRRRRIRWRRR